MFYVGFSSHPSSNYSARWEVLVCLLLIAMVWVLNMPYQSSTSYSVGHNSYSLNYTKTVRLTVLWLVIHNIYCEIYMFFALVLTKNSWNTFLCSASSLTESLDLSWDLEKLGWITALHSPGQSDSLSVIKRVRIMTNTIRSWGLVRHV